MWSISSPLDPVTPCRGNAWRILHAKSESRSIFASRDGQPVIMYKVEPVAAPGYVTMYAVVPLDLQRHVRRVAIAGHVLKTHLAVVVEARGDDAHGRFDLVLARCDAAHRGQRHHQADRTVPAHVQAADVVEENHARRTTGIARRKQQRADQHVGAARFVHHCRAEPVELRAEPLAPLGERAASRIGSAGNDHARRLAAGMRVDDVYIGSRVIGHAVSPLLDRGLSVARLSPAPRMFGLFGRRKAAAKRTVPLSRVTLN